MTLQKAQEIKKLCNKIEEIEQKIEEIKDCSYIEIKVVKSPFYEDIEDFTKIYRNSRIYDRISQGYKEERDSLITELDLI
jgi:hypothetical protein